MPLPDSVGDYHHLCIYNTFKVVMVMVFNVTFNNISVISWWSVMLGEETGVPGSRKP